MIPTIPDPRFVRAIRQAVLRILLEAEGQPTRMIVDADLLIAEALIIFRDEQTGMSR
jgi:hypothetical protein